MVSYATSITTPEAKICVIVLATLVAKILIRYKNISFYEWLHAADVGRVYFDVDGKASETTAEALLETALAGVVAFLELPPDSPPARLSICDSHGGNKLSFRIFLRDYKMVIGDQKRRLKRLGLDKNRPFDDAVYGKNQKLRMVGSYKTPDDKRVLDLLDRGCPTEQSILDTIVQHVTDDMVLLTEPDTQPSTQKQAPKQPTPQQPSRKRAQPEPSAGDDTVLLADDDSVPMVVAREYPATRAPSDTARAERLLSAAGFKDVTWLSTVRPQSATFSCDRSKCVCCSGQHDSQNWWCSEQQDGELHVKNYSPSCMVRRLCDPPQSSEAIITHQQAEQHLCAIQNATYSLGVYVHQQRSYVDVAMDPLKMQLASVVPTSYGFDFCCEGRDEKYQCAAIIQSCCQISSCNGDPPLITGYHDAQLLGEIVRNPLKGDSNYAMWLLDDQHKRGKTWKYDAEVGKLYQYGGIRWEPVLEHTLQTIFLRMAITQFGRIRDGLNSIAPSLPKKQTANLEAALNHVQSSRTPKGVVDSVKMMIAHPGFADTLDLATHLLGCPNGVIDLRTGTLAPTNAQHPISMSTRSAFRGLDLPTPDVDDFFATVFDGDIGLIEYMQHLLGASVTGEHLQVYVCWTGLGSNGKGVLNDWLRHCLGEYYLVASPYIFFGERVNRGGATPDLACLHRIRLAVVDESGDDDILNTAMIKRATGSDALPVRRLYRDPFEMPITHTQVLLTNSLPKIDVEDEAIQRRIIVIPFKLRFMGDDHFDAANPTHRHKDPALLDLLKSDSVCEQLLVWLVRGAKQYYEGGRKMAAKPPAVLEAERGYYSANDTLAELIEEECEMAPDFNIPAAAFNQVAAGRGVKKVTAAMERRGYACKSQRVEGKSVRCYLGIRFKS